MWLCLLWSKLFEETNIWKPTVEKGQTNAINVTMLLFGQAIWGHIWKPTLEKSHTNATNVTMLLLIQAIWRHKWKPKLEKSKTNATNVTMSALIQAIWRHIRKPTVEKGQTNATNVTMLLLGKAIWGHIWKKTWMKIHNLFTHSCRGRGSSGNARKKTFFSYGGVSLCCFWEGGVPPQPPSPDRDRSTITTICIFRWVRESQSRSFLRPALPPTTAFVRWVRESQSRSFFELPHVNYFR